MEGDSEAYPVELLHQQTEGLPPHKLELKEGMPVMLLRNMSTHGLTNGTRMIVKRIMAQLLKCEIATGPKTGEIMYLPIITLQPSESFLPFTMKRRQFPVRPCFAMTINKAQGQTLQQVFGYLPRSCFSHGQLYVMISRVGSAARVRLYIPDRYKGKAVTENVVFSEVLQG